MGVEIEKYHKSEIAVCGALTFTPFGICGLRLTLKLIILLAFKHLPFYPKWRNTTSLKRYLLKTFSMDFSELIEADIELMLGKVLKFRVDIFRRF